ncbi:MULTISPECIES: hypothetical protein [Haloferax]|uniref:DUF8048 domain-containing protein n=1 Tax=Haloferax marinum TaxID=2666143 RepID=A0A6A8G8J4_9EURY|nr:MULTISPECIES: hypothetical protein [Haloferax]KAB1198240.1 hypothetical protein Hfx1150_12245 [Haloferax sp. CBA1150]MRW97331.1 hypothetical protein [Haloferax marinum]
MTVGADGDPYDSHRTPERLSDRLDPDGDDSPRGGAIDGTAIMIAAAKASVPAALVPTLLDRAQAYLDDHAGEYARTFECVYEDDDVAVYFVPLGHWDTKGAELGFSHREVDAVRRAHAEHLRRIGTDSDRRSEFETALEIREVAVIDAV